MSDGPRRPESIPPAVRLPGGDSAAGDDAVRPFAVEALDLRGRAVQLGAALDGILGRHAYPEAVSKLVAEAVVLAALLGSSLKFEGKFSLQAESDGPVGMLVVDFRTPGDLRAYASFREAAVAEAVAAGAAAPGSLLGRGVLAMTIDQGPASARYQGLVPLDGGNLEEAAHTYFRQSEQIPTRVRLAAAPMLVRGPDGLETRWRAGGVLAQFMPDSPLRARQQDLPGGDVPEGAELPPEADEDDAWREAQALVATVEDHELLDPEVPAERLLFRLFHERGVRVFEPLPVRDKCSCSRRKIETMLREFSAEAIEESVENGVISVTCEFCGKRYVFEPAQFRS